MIKIPLPILGVYHISESPFRFRFGPIEDFLPFAIMSLARAFQGVGEWTKPLLGMRVGSCVGGWKSPVFLDVPFGAIPSAPAAIEPASPIIVQGHDPCEWLEAETEERAKDASEGIKEGGAKMVLYLVPLRTVYR